MLTMMREMRESRREEDYLDWEKMREGRRAVGGIKNKRVADQEDDRKKETSENEKTHLKHKKMSGGETRWTWQVVAVAHSFPLCVKLATLQARLSLYKYITPHKQVFRLNFKEQKRLQPAKTRLLLLRPRMQRWCRVALRSSCVHTIRRKYRPGSLLLRAPASTSRGEFWEACAAQVHRTLVK